jgi:hypothetical protein
MATTINPITVVDIYKDLEDKLYELRVKRDAVSLQHGSLKRQSDSFNKAVILLSLTCGFTETLKSTLDLTNVERHGMVVTSVAVIAPIAISTICAVISSLHKFKDYPTRMEVLTKSSEQFNHCVMRVRKLQQQIGFIEPETARKQYIDEVMEVYRESLKQAEASIYPDVRKKYFARAQANILAMDTNSSVFMSDISDLNNSTSVGINIGVEE